MLRYPSFYSLLKEVLLYVLLEGVCLNHLKATALDKEADTERLPAFFPARDRIASDWNWLTADCLKLRLALRKNDYLHCYPLLASWNIRANSCSS
jgi:hypothetical protein